MDKIVFNIQRFADGRNVDNSQSNVVLTGTPYADTIKNNASYVTISAGGDNDSVFSIGDNVLIDGGAGKNTLEGVGSNLTINGGNDNDTILNITRGYNVSVNGNGGNDYIAISHSGRIVNGQSVKDPHTNITLNGGAGNDTLRNNNDDIVYMVGGAGDDSIFNAGDSVTVDAGGGNDIIENGRAGYTVGSNSSINGGFGNDIIDNSSSNVTINGGEGDDHVNNWDSAVKIFGDSGNDVIGNWEDDANNVTIEGGVGKDSVTNYGRFALIDGNSDGDSIYNGGDNATVYGGSGNDSIHDLSSDTKLFGGDGNDTLIAAMGYLPTTIVDEDGQTIYFVDFERPLYSTSSLYGGNGDDYILHNGKNAYIDGEAGKDIIVNYGSNITISGGTGDDTIVNAVTSGMVYRYAKGDGNDSVIGWTAKDTMSITGGAWSTSTVNNDVIVSIEGGAKVTLTGAKGQTLNIYPKVTSDWIENADSNKWVYGTTAVNKIKNSGSNVSINAYEGNDTVSNTGVSVTAYLGAGNDSIYNTGKNAKIYGDAGNDKIYNYNSGDNSYIDGGASNDSIYAPDGNYVTITGGAGADSIKGKFWSSSIVGGADADKISLYGGGTKNTVKAGTGNDTIYSSITSGVMYQYAKGDGKDSIKGWTAKDTLNVTGGNYTTVKSGNNVQVKVGNGAVTLLNAAGKKLNIIGKKDTGSGSTQGKNISNAKNRVTLTGGAGNDTIYNTGKYVTVNAGNGNDSISGSYNYALINAGAGNDTINSRDEADYETIIAGTGNDVVSLVNYTSYTQYNLIKYSNGDGNDTIFGFNADDTIHITNAKYTTSVKGKDFIIKVGSGSITLKDVLADKYYKIHVKDSTGKVPVYNDWKVMNGTASADTLNNYADKVTVNGLGGNDSIFNTGDSVQVNGGEGNDTIKNGSDNGGNNSTINSGNGTSYIENRGDNVKIIAGSGKDTIENLEGDNAFIDGGAGNDFIENRSFGNNNVTISGGAGNDILWHFSYGSADNVKIDGDAGKDSICNTGGKKLTINGGAADDYISNSGHYVGSAYFQADNNLINGGAGNDNISNCKSNKSTINGGTGNDTIYNTYSSNTMFLYSKGDGNDIIYGFSSSDSLKIGNGTTDTYAKATVGSNVLVSVGSGVITLSGAAGVSGLKILGKEQSAKSKLIVGTEGADKIKNNDSNVTIKALGGNDTVSNTGVSLTAYLGKGNDSIYNTGKNAKIYGDAGNDKIYNYKSGDNSYIDGGAGNDSIYAPDGNYVTITGGAGADTIKGKFWSSSIAGGADADKISLYGGGSKNTVKAGTGNDTIYSSITSGVMYQYAKGDGKDSIKGWTAKDTLNITGGSYTTVKSGNNVQVKVGSGAVTLLNAAGKKLNIIGKKDSGSGSTQGKNISNVKDRVTLTGGAGADTIYNTGKYVTVNAGSGNDSISGSYNYALINAGDGNDIVSVNGNYDNIYADAMGTYIKGGAGNDSILGGIDYGEVDAGTGNDVIRGSYHYSYISGGDGNDKIELSGINVSEGGYVNTINAGKGNDTISHDAKDKRGHIYRYAKGDGNDTIIAFSSFDTLHITSGSYTTSTVGNDLIVKVGSNSIRLKNALENPTNKIQIKDSAGKVKTYNNLSVITGTNGADSLSNKNSNRVTINALAGNDIILNDDGGYVVINAGDGNDSINNTGNYVTIKAGNGNDTITGTAFDSTVDAGAGHDFVSVIGGGGKGTKYELGAGNDTIYTSIWGTVNAGAGNDRISIGAGNPFTVNAGKGNDFIYSQAKTSVSIADSVRVYQYANGDGNDTIISYSTNDSLKITGSYTTKRKGNDVIVSVGKGSMLLKDFSGDTLNINGKTVTVGDSKDDNNKLIIGTDGADNISNTLSGATIKALGGNDTVINTGESVTAYMGAGNDSIYNKGLYATIYGENGADYIYSYNNHANIYADSDNDTIYNYGSYSYISGGNGNDKITIDGGYSHTVNAGTGNDTLYSPNTIGLIYQYAKGDGNDSIIGWTAHDTMSITGGSHKMSTVGNDVIVSITGGAKVTLSGAKGKTINVISESDDTAPTTPTSTVTAQEVIKKFMKSLDTTNNSGKAALNEAVSVASGGYFTNIQSAINSMVNDIKTSSDSATFLLDKCGINLDNDDTGAITGYDAGSSKTAKTANSIVPESGSLKTYTGNSFNAADVTFKLADYNKFNDKYDTVSTINYSSLTNNAQKYIWNGLYTWWATSSLNLIADSYGDNYSFGVNSSATAKEIYFGFYNENSSTLAVTTGWKFSEGPDAGHTKKIGLFVNMNHFSDINTSDPNGNASGGYLDRTLAHEFTHAVMKANINYFDNLPQFITEGMAELTHGIDDERYYNISELAGNSTKLKNVLNLSDLGTGTEDAYSGGYMFLRYLAKQGSEHYGSATATSNSNAKALTAQSSNVSLSGSVLTVTSKPSDGVIDLTKYSSSVRKIDASKLTGGVMIIGNTYANSIKGGTGTDTISANTGNDTIYGGKGNDLIFGDAGNDKIYGDAGNDTLNGGTGKNTLTGGAGNDVFVHKYGDDLILDYTAKQDKIKIVEESMNSVSVSGSNVIFNFANSSVTVKGGKGKDITLIDKDGTASTKKYNASMTFSSSNLAASSEFWFDDSENFATDDTQLDAINTPTETNYSVASIDDFSNLDNLAQINELVTTQGYSGALNKKKN